MQTKITPFLVLLSVLLFFIVFCTLVCNNPQPDPSLQVLQAQNDSLQKIITADKQSIAYFQTELDSLRAIPPKIIYKYKTIFDTIKVQTLPQLQVGVDSIYGTTVLIDDTLLCFDSLQVAAIQINTYKLFECRELLKNSTLQIQVLDSVVSKQANIISNQNILIDNKDAEIKHCEDQIVKERLWKRIGWGVAALFGMVAVAK